MNNVRANIRVNGIVQGVGFRPFIHRLASERSLAGWIRNTASGAEIEVEGGEMSVKAFSAAIMAEKPPLADIVSITEDYSEDLKEYASFEIIESDPLGEMNTLISPDIGICADCRHELLDPKDRRFRYPFINCTNCGPRFTIIRSIPYDRAHTSMAGFPMCPECTSEYNSITDRRYHAQPDCCPACGPRIEFRGGEGSCISESDGASDAVIANIVQALQQGKIAAIRGLGGFHLACRGDDPEIALKLRSRKRRDEKPFALMCRDLAAARDICEVSNDEAAALESFQKPIVLLKKKNRTDFGWISENAYIGVMLPFTPLHVLIMEEFPCLIMTSANLSDLPIIYRNEQAVHDLAGIADVFLLHDRDIVTRCDDSVLRVIRGREYFIRRSRGYVPYPLLMDLSCCGEASGQKPVYSRQSSKTMIRRNMDCPRVLACGAEQKASFALAKGNYVFPSQHIGDLKNIETLAGYEEQIEHFENMFDISPDVIVCDMHPDYLSTEYAERRAEGEGIQLMKVQHHHAHMASCMADNNLTGECIGIIWDGTGYGEDGSIWGGEFLVGGYSGFERAGAIRKIALPGGDKAVTEIWRCAAALLEDAGIDSCGYFERESLRSQDIGGSDIDADNRAKVSAPWGSGSIPEKRSGEKYILARGESYIQIDEMETVRHMLENGINRPESSGMGRLFDGVSAVLGIRTQASYEGQGAVLLEAFAGASDGEYPYTISRGKDDGLLTFDFREMIRCIVRDADAGRDRSLIAADFMNTLVSMAAEMCVIIRDGSDLYKKQCASADVSCQQEAARNLEDAWNMLNRVVLSGGTFQNVYLLERLTDRLKRAGFEVFTHRRVSTNDEGISLGQAAIAMFGKNNNKQS